MIPEKKQTHNKILKGTIMAKKKKIITRKEAIAAGKSVYYTGKVCKNGHNAMRYVTSSTCIECQRISRDQERALIKSIREKVAA